MFGILLYKTVLHLLDRYSKIPIQKFLLHFTDLIFYIESSLHLCKYYGKYEKYFTILLFGDAVV